MKKINFSIFLTLLCSFLTGSIVSQIVCKPNITHVSCTGSTNGSVVLTNVTGGVAPYTYTWQPGSTGTNSITSKGYGAYTVTVKGTGTVTSTYAYNVGYKVRWQNMYTGMSQSNDTLKHGTGGGSWLYAANSSNMLNKSTDGWVEYIVTSMDNRIFGLSDSGSVVGWNKVDYGIILNSGGTYNTCNDIGTGSPSQISIGSYTIGDVMRIERSGALIIYKKNGTQVWSTTITTGMQQSKMFIEAAIHPTGKTLDNVGCSFQSANAYLSIPTTTLSCLVPTVNLTAITNVAAANYSWSPGGSSPTASVSTFSDLGNYTLKVTEPFYGCYATAIATISVNRCKPNITHVSCTGSTNGSVVLTNVTGGVAPYTYTWQPGSTGTNSITSKGYGAYTVTVKGTGTVTSTYAYNVGYKVRWQNMYTGMSQSNDTLKHGTGGASWLYSANSSNMLDNSTDGWVEYVVTSRDGRIFGLSDSGSVVGWNKVDYGIILNSGGTYNTCNDIGTGSPSQISIGSYTIGDVMRIERSGALMVYRKNGAQVWSTPITTGMQQSKMFIEAAIHPTGKTLDNVGCSFQSANGLAKGTLCAAPAATLTAYTNVASASYSWSPAVTNPTASVTTTTASGTYSVKITEPFYGCQFVATVMVMDCNSYAVMNKEISSQFYKVIANRVYFKYDGEYNSHSIKYNIYNKQHQIIASNSVGNILNSLSVVSGDNRYFLDVSGASFIAGYYLLEVIDEKNDKLYLKFKK
jgi:hypothetical protein